MTNAVIVDSRENLLIPECKAQLRSKNGIMFHGNFIAIAAGLCSTQLGGHNEMILPDWEVTSPPCRVRLQISRAKFYTTSNNFHTQQDNGQWAISSERLMRSGRQNPSSPW